MRLTFLGTGAGLPSKNRHTQSMVFNFMQELKECWMFDCGEASQHQIMNTTIRPGKIKKIFISHMHGDHILGLIGFLTSRTFLLREDGSNLQIFGPVGIKEYVESNLRMIKAYLSYDIDYVEFDSQQQQVIYEDDKVKVETFLLDHTIESYAFKISFERKKGNLLVDKLKDLGITPGLIYREIKQHETFEFAGKFYNSSDFMTPDSKGKVITILSDTAYFDRLNDFLSGTDILVTESTYLSALDKDLALKHKHMSIEDIYEFRKYNRFDQIYLTHISSRYMYDFLKELQEELDEKNMYIVSDLKEFNI
ncbi:MULTISPECIES: ribonuclease Z [unclassified Gemella]|uniref:ribonuclease Z n=1 Tax=unclassified Gemella TaxID=2624949 RepID=UPI0010748032|nr:MULTISPECIES: ribonuclease Z [unclassified Gemella]MBF0709844.1 ribonuclease Z [Gemella sp. GL1.1]MBF0746851.1 ribonuclease Z [Gemella sp. 19428wG2_WT2a]NYS27188.1 ribonuclease Z [Gemella sp. GL1]TFU59575.1 ribonuclease Z [Gemella sp. WT2a]